MVVEVIVVDCVARGSACNADSVVCGLAHTLRMPTKNGFWVVSDGFHFHDEVKNMTKMVCNECNKRLPHLQPRKGIRHCTLIPMRYTR